ncbi:hypothetical protein B0H11DRAFT_1906140 [Mycena galericulata]|nr:hypothetical protein B0H11DRAFT_1906140 [Mycena galericulata]
MCVQKQGEPSQGRPSWWLELASASGLRLLKPSQAIKPGLRRVGPDEASTSLSQCVHWRGIGRDVRQYLEVVWAKEQATAEVHVMVEKTYNPRLLKSKYFTGEIKEQLVL